MTRGKIKQWVFQPSARPRPQEAPQPAVPPAAQKVGVAVQGIVGEGIFFGYTSSPIILQLFQCID
jgi:hypothetical protein